MEKCLKKTHKKKQKNRLKNQKMSLQLLLMANLYHVNGPIDMRVWKGCRFEIILKLDSDLR